MRAATPSSEDDTISNIRRTMHHTRRRRRKSSSSSQQQQHHHHLLTPTTTTTTPSSPPSSSQDQQSSPRSDHHHRSGNSGNNGNNSGSDDWIPIRMFRLLLFYSWTLPWSKFYSLVDRLILVCAEYTKTVVREVLLLLGQIFNSVIIFVMFIIYEPAHYGTTALFQPVVNLAVDTLPSNDGVDRDKSSSNVTAARSSGNSGSGADASIIMTTRDVESRHAGSVDAVDAVRIVRGADEHAPVGSGVGEQSFDQMQSPPLSPTLRRENKLTPVLKQALESAIGGIRSPLSVDEEMDDDDEFRLYPQQINSDDMLSEEGSWLLEDEAEQLPSLNSFTRDIDSTTAAANATEAVQRYWPGAVVVGNFTRLPLKLLKFANSVIIRVLIIIYFWYTLFRKIVRLLISSPFLFRKPYLENAVSPTKRELLRQGSRSTRRAGERRKSAATLGIAADRVHRKEKVTSGLFEDILTAQFQFVDEMAVAAMYIARLWLPSAFKQIFTALRLFHPKNFISKEGIDQRTIRQLIRDEGYPYEKVEVVTKDGYILRMDRIPNRKSNKIIFFQHGILDSAFAWVAQGADNSIAFRAHHEGYDVWMGNFRGYGLSLKTSHPLNAQRDYWNFSFNEHAFYDIRAFVEKIVQVKRRELGCPLLDDNDVMHESTQQTTSSGTHEQEDSRINGERQQQLLAWDKENFTITAIAHSMGAASILAYLVHQRIHRWPHHVDDAILLSPAGIHEKFPMVLHILSTFGLPLLPSIIPLYYAGFTSTTSKIILSKLFQDINSHPAMRSLFATLTSLSLLGGPVKTSPFQRIHNIWMHTFNGTSIKVLKHFAQMSISQKFQAYDYGAKGNMENYNSKEPLDFLENYHLVDIPITIVYGEDDRVIPAENVLRHYVALQTFHPRRISLKRYDRIGHLDLCHGANEQLIQYVLKTLRQAHRRRNLTVIQSDWKLSLRKRTETPISTNTPIM